MFYMYSISRISLFTSLPPSLLSSLTLSLSLSLFPCSFVKIQYMRPVT